jgi:RimJ/RimL family protein N-acetyltransferase
MPRVLHTKHLMLRPGTLADLDAVQSLWHEPAVRRFLFDDRSISRQEVRDFLAASDESFAQQGYGLWVFFERPFFERPGEAMVQGRPFDHRPLSPILDCLLDFSGLIAVPDGPPSLVFGTQPQLWGRGYAREAAAEVLRYVFDELGLEQVVADVDEPNTASIHVLERLGMVQTGRAMVNDRPSALLRSATCQIISRG